MTSTIHIKRAIILAAGFGTRMGPLGKLLPKVMWPVFEKSLLELQVCLARDLGVDEIYINLHHQRAEIMRRCQKLHAFKDVIWLIEEPNILDIGGGIHNLANRPEVAYQGHLLVLNADQLLLMNKSQLDSAIASYPQASTILLTQKVNSSDGYNALILDHERQYCGVKLNGEISTNTEIETYSGNAIINLAKLKPVNGPSKFFDSICLAKQDAYAFDLAQVPYWDFGTAKRYEQSLFRALECSNKLVDPLWQFLGRHQAYKKNYLQEMSYHGDHGVLNFSGYPQPRAISPCIILEAGPDSVDQQQKGQFVFGNDHQPL